GQEGRTVACAFFLRDGKTVVSEEEQLRGRAERTHVVRVWDAESGREVRSVPLKDYDLPSPAFAVGRNRSSAFA
ncbi:MAG TPA: hypothetical protein VG013_33040, partial [Gemmataceae bacterium]|nr:hypothetical protein [Gemmataceae bacterium]